MKKVVFILGPTAVGKSYFGILLAKKFGGEIISADSVQVYKGLDIGSAKQLDTHGVTHHCIDILSPFDEFSAYDFVELTKKKIDEISNRGHLPIVVGGTGLYIKALTLGYNFGGVEKDENLRKNLEEILKSDGLEKLVKMLEEKDKSVADKIDRKNPVRVLRALEIALSNGEKSQSKSDIQPLVIALFKDRAKLYADINRRVDEMVADGLFEEVEGLKKMGLTKENQSMRAIGYKETLDYLDGLIDKERCVELIKQHTRNYAKRQITFLKGMDCEFVDAENRELALEKIEKMVGEFLNGRVENN